MAEEEKETEPVETPVEEQPPAKPVVASGNVKVGDIMVPAHLAAKAQAVLDSKNK